MLPVIWWLRVPLKPQTCPNYRKPRPRPSGTMASEVNEMRYMKIFTDFMDVLEPLNEAEAGRLFLAMLRYAADGAEPEPVGNERFLWRVAKQHLDREAEAYEAKAEACREAGRRSGEARKRTKAKQNEPTATIRNQTNQDNDKDNDKDKNNDKEKDKDISFLPDRKERLAAEKKETHPSLSDVIQYAEDARIPADAQHFFDYYEANGWHIGQQPVRDWKAALRAWARNAPVSPRAAPPHKLTARELCEQTMALNRMQEAKEAMRSAGAERDAPLCGVMQALRPRDA